MKTRAKVASLAVVASLANCFGAYAHSMLSGMEFAPGEGISYDEAPIFTAEASVEFHSRYMSYGVVDGKDPIVKPCFCGTFADWVFVGADFICDTTKGNGKGFGYGNRAGKYSAIDSYVGLAHEFELGETLGALSAEVGYLYEYATRSYEDGYNWDMQYLYLELSLGDLPFEPKFYLEREFMFDDGTYANFEIGHTIDLGGICDGLSVRPSIAQGVGNTRRALGYFGESHGGLMDTCVKLEFEYEISDWCTFGAYASYYDYLFDGNMRDLAREYNSVWGNGCDHSWSFVGGLSVKLTF